MYLIAERLRRPMRRQFGGNWVSMAGIPPITPLFLVMSLYTMVQQRIAVARRRRKVKGDPENPAYQAFVGSWF
jgi:hypothetical protein